MSIISVAQNKSAQYPNKKYLFRPYINYPEYLFKADLSPEPNDVYDLVRHAFIMMRLDEEHFDSALWNPFGNSNYIKPGDTVLIKPNLVLDKNHGDGGTDCLYTHPSVVAAVIDYVCIALQGNGKIVIADAPLQTCNFERLVKESGYLDLVNYYKSKGVDVELVDLRGLTSSQVNDVIHAELNNRTENAGVCVSLDGLSMHAELSTKCIEAERITSYDPAELKKHHSGQKHEYLIAKEVLNADCIINICKPKTHRKAGVTISLKNFIGINVRKEYLPHHRIGGSVKGIGDEYQGASVFKDFESHLIDIKNTLSADKRYFAARMLVYIISCIRILGELFDGHKNSYSEGSWFGNDTIWRTIVDLNRIVKYVDKAGNLQSREQRKIFCVGDMVVMGEGEGPLMPTPKHVGIIAIGENCVCFDEIIATLMGMNISLIPSISNTRKLLGKMLLVDNGDAGIISSNNSCWNLKEYAKISRNDSLQLTPTNGWKRHIELENNIN